jgi:ABC-type multidrug transport system fused ATPase/permease subunit
MANSPGRHRARERPALTGLLLVFVRPYVGQTFLVVLLLAVQAAGNLYLPSISANIINNGVVKGDTGYIWRAGGLMLAVALGAGLVSVLAVYRAAHVSMAVGRDIRGAIYRRVKGFSAREMSGFGVPSLITRNLNDALQVQQLLRMALTLLVTAVLVSVGGVIMAVHEDAELSLLLVVAVPVMALVTAARVAAVVPLFRSMQGKVDRINQVLREQITGVRVIRAFSRTRAEQDRFDDASADLAATVLRVSRIYAVAVPAMTFVLTLLSAAALWFGGRLVSQGSMPIGNLTAFLVYITQILVSCVIAVQVFTQLPRAAASAERIAQVLRTVPVISSPPHPVSPASITGAVEFRGVTFGYPGSERPVLRDLTFAIRPGQTCAVIGGIGSGKTTMLNLSLRFLDVTGGAVLVNETDVRMQSADRLRSTIGLVPQAAFLFRGTIASNLRFGLPEATDEELWRALDVAQALDFVASMPGQLDARIDQGGTNVSGGQRQRLAIARSILRRPRLYLFDDCFSALDAGTDARLRSALRAETRDATVVMVAQRVSTIMHADQIIVLDAGQLAGLGTHEELLAGCDLYGKIVDAQLGEGAAA